MSAHAAVVYLVVETGMSESLKFVTSKARVASIQTQTIPWLELLFALLLIRLITSVSSSLNSPVELTFS